MHVLALVTDAFGSDGGIARYNRDLFSALAATAGVGAITILPREAPQPPEPLPAKVCQRSAVLEPMAYAMVALREARRSPKGTVVFCGHLLMAPLAVGIARLWSAPFWLQVHGIDAWDPPSRHVRWAAEQADLVTAVSRYTRRRMISGWWGADPARIRVLPNTVDPAFAPGPKPAALIARYGLGARRVLLTVSRLSEADRYKGHDRVLAALPTILSCHPETVYLIVGDGEDLPRLRELVASAGLNEHVRFAGHVPAAELADHYRVADVFVMPSTEEGFGIVFLEAAACGLHVIGGNQDGSVDALREGAIGEAVDPMDIDEIAMAVCQALEAPERPNAARVGVYSLEGFRRLVGRLVDEFGTPRVC